MKQKSHEIIGKTVINTDGFVIGEVNDYLVDVETWTVSDLQLKIERKKAKELNLKVSFFKLGALLVLVGVDHVHSITDQVILDLDAEAFATYIAKRQQEGAGDEDSEPAEDAASEPEAR